MNSVEMDPFNIMYQVTAYGTNKTKGICCFSC